MGEARVVSRPTPIVKCPLTTGIVASQRPLVVKGRGICDPLSGITKIWPFNCRKTNSSNMNMFTMNLQTLLKVKRVCHAPTFVTSEMMTGICGLIKSASMKKMMMSFPAQIYTSMLRYNPDARQVSNISRTSVDN